MDKTIVTKNFSKFSESYDEYTPVQKECSRKLLELIKEREFSHILEIGCGTGFHTAMLKEHFKDSAIDAIDSSGDMVSLAKKKISASGVRYTVADAETFTSSKKHDLITSNAAFQWFENIENTFSSLADLLIEDGVLCFSMYGPETFCELKEVLTLHFGRRKWLSSSKFVSIEKLERILRSNFGEYQIQEERFHVSFYSLWEFLKSIKYSGTRGEGLGGSIFLGKYMIKELEKTYIKKFNEIKATHHVYFCIAKR